MGIEPRQYRSHTAIARANRRLLNRLGIWEPAATETCWACGYHAGGFVPVRAHVKARAAGGSSSPRNFVLLCIVCHREQPDAASRPTLVRWLETREPWIDRAARQMAPIGKALRAAARELTGGEYVLVEWMAARGEQRIARLWDRAEARTAAIAPETTTANVASAMVADLLRWATATR